MEQKTTKNKKPAATSSLKSNNKVLWWILGGCLVLFVISGLVIGGIAYWGYKKVKREVKEKQQKFEEAQRRAESFAPQAETNSVPSGTYIPEESQTVENTGDNGVPSDIYPPAVTEKQMGFIKKVYAKGGKNYIDIDYIQWFMGDAAEKAMREDGECPKKGECLVLNDYYIRNVNPLIRTLEVAPDAEILAHDFSADYSTGDWNQSWTFSRFSQYFNSSAKNGYWDYAHFYVEIGNNQVLKITEQYIP